MPMDNKTKFNLWYVAAALFGLLLIQSLWTAYRQVEPIAYSEFQQYLQNGQIEEVVVSENFIQGTLKQPTPDGRSQFVTRRVDPRVAEELEGKGVRVVGATEHTWL